MVFIGCKWGGCVVCVWGCVWSVCLLRVGVGVCESVSVKDMPSF